MRKPPSVPPLSPANDTRSIVAQRSMQSRERRRLAYLLPYSGLFATAAIALYAIALLSADYLLAERNMPQRADIIVILGGDGPSRAARAAALWRDGMAPSVLVTGAGDCEFIRTSLVTAGVNAAAIATECRSQTTWENATFSKPLLDRLDVQQAILVTSWFHSKRAAKRFRSLMPDIQWISIPTEKTKSYWTLAGDIEGLQVFKEYAKIVAYDLRSSMPEMASSADELTLGTNRLP